MVFGYEGYCKLIDEDTEIALYSYSGININENYEVQKNYRFDFDGIILIYKCCLEEPEIHIKMKRRPSGRKYQSIKRIAHFPNIVKHIKNGDVVIEKECINAFRRYTDIDMDYMDYIAYILLVKIFTYYQENGSLPKSEGFAK